MHKYLPSKKFSYILLSIILALGIIYFFSWLRNRPVSTVKISGIEAKAKVQEFMALDTDGDDMKDWEEALWKTNPNKTDTDGDGTSDSAEIKINRDPLKQNINPANQEPSDKVSPEIIAENKKTEEEFNALSVTEKMGRMLFSQYVATKKANTELTELDKLQIIESTISNLPAIDFKSYSVDEIRTIDSVENNFLREYSNTIAEIILTNLKTEAEDIETILSDLSNTDDSLKTDAEIKIIFDRFDPLIKKNQKTVASLLTVTLPKILSKEHMDLINSFGEIYESLVLMQESASDLIILVPLLNTYDLSVEKLSYNLTNLAKKIASLKIAYESQLEYGNQFFNVIILK